MTTSLTFPYADPPAAGSATQVSPGVHWIRMPLPFALDHINLWLIEEGEGWAVVDTGFGVQATRDIWEQHFAATMGGKPITRILVTHYHPDHLGNAQWLAERFATSEGPLIPEMSLLELVTAHAVAGGTGAHQRSALAEFFRSHGLTPEQIEITANRGNTYSFGVPTRPTTCQRIIPGETIEIGGKLWNVIAGYGHTPEHLSFYCEETKVLISGDMLLPKISTNVNVWPVTALSDPVSEYVGSLQAFKYCEQDTLVLPSHGMPFRGIQARVEALETHHEARMSELYAAVSAEAKTAAELIPVLFRRQLDNHQLFFAIAEAVAHVNHGWRTGRLNRVVASDGTIRFSLRN
jgi:glyoxylase-like metal-dependent hydrolase (beta-lactamase superfamily II)